MADYDQHRDDAAERSREKSAAGREIGELPPVADPARKAEAEGSLRRFCEIYFAGRFRRAWSPDHLQVLARIEEAAAHGGLFALAMPRGAGKTAICEVAVLWAAFNGSQQYVVLIGATATMAAKSLGKIKTELRLNELLAADFPEVCYPIRKMQKITQRANAQTYQGKPTEIAWTKDTIALPFIPGSKASGALISTSGLTGAGLRGPSYTRPDGQLVRPSLLIIDDPQTSASAKSLTQCEDRELLIEGAALGMAGDKKIAVVMPMTVIRKGDVADSFLDRDKHPEWTGQRFKMLNSFPTATELWEKYRADRADELRNGGDGSLTTQFYRERQAEMDAGAVAGWNERFNGDEISAIQHAMHLLHRNKWAFHAEYQNEPLEQDLGENQLETDALARRTNGLPRGTVPLWATRLTAHVDVQQKLLYWLVAAWADNFTGAIIDYGAWPDQGRKYFTADDAQKTLARASPGHGREAALLVGLQKCADALLRREWPREDGIAMKIERLLVDAGYQGPTVYSFCRQAEQAAVITPAKGEGVTPNAVPWTEYKQRPGEKLGTHWILAPVATGKRAVRLLRIDVNHWKSFTCERLLQAVGDRGSLSLFGRSAQEHRMLAEHLSAEYHVRTEGRGRVVNVWQPRPNCKENHWWDCLVGCAAAASMQGAALIQGEATPAAGKPKKRVRWSQVVAERRARSGS